MRAMAVTIYMATIQAIRGPHLALTYSNFEFALAFTSSYLYYVT